MARQYGGTPLNNPKLAWFRFYSDGTVSSSLSGTVTFTESDTLASVGSVSTAGSVALAESDSVVSIGDVSTSATVILAEQDALSASGNVVVAASAALTESDALSSAGNVSASATVILSDSDVVSVSGTVTVSAAVALTEQDVFAASDISGPVSGPIALIESDSLAASGGLSLAAVVVLSDVESIAATGDISTAAVVALMGSDVLAASDASNVITGSVALAEQDALFATGGPFATFVSSGDVDDPKRRKPKHVRESLLEAWAGDRDAVAKVIAPYARFAEVTPHTINLEALSKDLVRVEQIIQRAKELREDDEEALLLLLD